jgi:hypothetical protein
MITTGTVFGNPGGGSANVQVVPAAVPALMMPGAPLNGTRTTVFVPTTCRASVCAGPVLASVTVPSPVQVASNKTPCWLLTGSALALLRGTSAVAAAIASAKKVLFMLSPSFVPAEATYSAPRVLDVQETGHDARARDFTPSGSVGGIGIETMNRPKDNSGSNATRIAHVCPLSRGDSSLWACWASSQPTFPNTGHQGETSADQAAVSESAGSISWDRD